MLRPIPFRLLKSTAEVRACTAVDRYQQQTYTTYHVSRVHLQPTNEVRKTQANTDCVLRSMLFVDRRYSTPALDWFAIYNTAHGLGGDVRVIVNGETYTVQTVDKLYDDTNRLHHWEIGLV